MSKLNKCFSLILAAFLAASSLIMVESATAQSIPKPSVPEFTVKYVDRSYTVPANYSYETNPYTGEQVRTGHGEYRVDNETIELKIRNQPFTPYKDPETQRFYQLCYNVSWKGHYQDTWNYYRYYIDSYSQPSEGSVGYGHLASNSEYTILLFSFGTDRESSENMPNLGKLPPNSQVDFRVQALFGYYTVTMVDWVPGFRPTYANIFTGTSSDWSDTQTITLHPTSLPTPTQPSTSTPTLDSSPIMFDITKIIEGCSLGIFFVVVAFLLGVIVSLLLYIRHRSGKNPYDNQ
ncbi:MAG: hypothetical protein NWE98_00745 [Candidatus Bathyarchaeota archaeon]|nr:hypothetical protein [Candidatus Bathyarchaeota archaeon]